ncbi:MAG: DUF362 domain-containing protein [Acidobacteria bacterium]|nr:DUF362 domain-containing protein [Acidobacteriota bacterium]
MTLGRRDFFSTMMGAAAAAQVSGRAAATKLSMPGLFPGRVVSVRHPGCYLDGKSQAEPIRAMMRKGMAELTSAPDWTSAWRMFFEKGDVVGIKVNPVGQPDVISCTEVLQEIIAGLNQAGVPNKDIVVYDRYRQQFLRAGFQKWLPEGVREDWAAQDYQQMQLGMDGYDPDHYMEMALAQPGQDPRDAHVRRSYVAQFLTKRVNKLVNLPVLKHHQSAGVTLALKNLSHGLVNNVNRSHSSSTLNACGPFIPAVVNIPVIRDKTVLHVLDGILGMYHGGPGGRKGKYVFVNHTLYFATDPVAVDKTGWAVLDSKRLEKGMATIALSKPDADSTFLNCQPEHVEIAAALGLGVWDEKKIERKEFKLA